MLIFGSPSLCQIFFHSIDCWDKLVVSNNKWYPSLTEKSASPHPVLSFSNLFHGHILKAPELRNGQEEEYVLGVTQISNLSNFRKPHPVRKDCLGEDNPSSKVEPPRAPLHKLIPNFFNNTVPILWSCALQGDCDPKIMKWRSIFCKCKLKESGYRMHHLRSNFLAKDLTLHVIVCSSRGIQGV